MSVLVIGATERSAIQALVERASGNPRTRVQLAALAKRVEEGTFSYPVNTDFTIDVPHDFSITYTHDETEVGMVRHLSVSLGKRGKLPARAAVEMLCTEFGFQQSLDECLTWAEEFAAAHYAVNVCERIVTAS